MAFTEAQIEVAAHKLWLEGEALGWWKAIVPLSPTTWETMDVIGKDEFKDLVARVLQATEVT